MHVEGDIALYTLTTVTVTVRYDIGAGGFVGYGDPCLLFVRREVGGRMA